MVCGAVWMAACGAAAVTVQPDKPVVKERATQPEYWVEVTCSRDRGEGKHNFGKHNIIQMPGDQVLFVIQELDGSCRVWGAIVPPEREAPDKCDIRLRSRETLATVNGRCFCVPGHYKLQEGRPTSPDCCRRFPEAIYCKDGAPPPFDHYDEPDHDKSH